MAAPEWIVGFVFTMVNGGNDTMTGMLGGAAELLDAHRDQRQILIHDPPKIAAAIDEFLRLTTPVQNLARTTTRDVTIDSETIPAGEKVMLLFASGQPRRARVRRKRGPTRRDQEDRHDAGVWIRRTSLSWSGSCQTAVPGGARRTAQAVSRFCRSTLPTDASRRAQSLGDTSTCPSQPRRACRQDREVAAPDRPSLASCPMGKVKPIRGKRILLTGVTGQVAAPLARNLVAAENTVFGTSRFANPAQIEACEAEGVHPIRIDLEASELEEIPESIDYAIHMAVSKDADFPTALAANAEGTAFLIEKCKGVKAFLHCSSCGVYEPNGLTPHVETDPLGDNHRPMGFLPTYSISKIAAESAARYASRRFGVPAVIARLDVPYGPTHGWPKIMADLAQVGIPTAVHPDGPNLHNFLHDDDLLTSLPYLLDQADVPPPIFNWCNPEMVSIEEWTACLTELTGIEIPLEVTTACIPPNPVDPSKLLALGWEPSVSWREGFRRLAEHSFGQ